MKKISPLKKGDTISIISPAGPIKDIKALNKAVSYFESKGYKVKVSPNALAQEDYLAGDDDFRFADLLEAFENPEIKAILCSRGGYGCARLLHRINNDFIYTNQKMFLGHSDITAILNNFPITTFHAPMAVSDFGCDEVDAITEKSFFEVIEGIKAPYLYEAKKDFKVINSGEANGKLVGGNLSVLISLMGTEYAPDFGGRILLLEDLNEPLYKIDRMLTQLKLAGVFERISGLVVADFGETEVSMEFLRSFCSQKPAFYGFYASHAKSKYTLPIGVEYILDADKGTLELVQDVF
ncbi:MAG: LD-carboxypeptidase [bacterium]